MHHQHRIKLQFRFELRDGRLARQQLQQVQQGMARRADMPRHRSLRTREEVALKAIEAKFMRHFEIGLGIDTQRDQQLACGLEHARELRQQCARRTREIDLDDLRIRQQFGEGLVGLRHLVEHETIAPPVQLNNAGNQRLVDFDRRRQFEHETVGRQMLDRVVEQHLAAYVDVSWMPGERAAYVALAQATNNGSHHPLRGIWRAARQGVGIRRRLRSMPRGRGRVRFGARRQIRRAHLDLIAAQHAVPIQNRLTREAGIQLRIVRSTRLARILDCDGGHSAPPLSAALALPAVFWFSLHQ